jgi:hypothetical protein
MRCRIRHRWTRWAFSLVIEGRQPVIHHETVWRMCRRCGAYQERESAEAAAQVATDWLLRWRARMP